MNHVAIVMSEETLLFEVVLKWPAFNPIGPRLEKGLIMPTCKTKGIETKEEAVRSAREIDQWLTRQEAGENTSQAKPVKYQSDHYGDEKFKLSSTEVKPAPKPAPPPAPKVKIVAMPKFVPQPFDE
jgi:hypothetical protein